VPLSDGSARGKRYPIFPQPERKPWADDLALAVMLSLESGPDGAPDSKRMAQFVDSFDADGFLDELERAGSSFIARSATRYPAGARSVVDSPFGLFVRGDDLDVLAGPTVAIVGSHSPSEFGREKAQELAAGLAAAGLIISSGLARGIGAAAHEAALEAEGRSLAVLGCGIDRDYPAANAPLAERLARRGLIVSEYAPGVEPAPWRIEKRNRLLATLATAVVVIEARERSGALLVASEAADLGRPVLSVEQGGELGAGIGALLREGLARPVRSVADVLASL